MLARTQKLIAVALLLVVGAGAVAGIRIGSPLYALGPLVGIGAAYAAVIGFEFLLLRRSFASEDPVRPSLMELARAWWAESTCAPRVFLWRQPFRSQVESDFVSAGVGRRGVLLVHGFFCNRGIWNPWMRELRAAGIPFVAVNLEPIFGPIDAYRRVVDDAVRRLERATDLAPIVVGHSMGGLAARAWLDGEAQLARCHRIVTIATPHHGTRLARHAAGANVRQMGIGSEWLARLDVATSAAVRTRLVCFWSQCDNIVIPVRNATVDGARNVHLAATPHVKMVYHPSILAEVIALAGRDTAAAV